MDLREVQEGLIPAIEEDLLFVAVASSAEDLGDACTRLSKYFQALAVCHLLESADTEKFRENLVRSGYARRHFLRRCRQDGNTDDKTMAVSRSEGVLDAAVSGRFDLALEIAALSNEEWDARWEYEDDYCFFRFVHLFIQDRSPNGKTSRQQVLARFEQALEGSRSSQLEVCRALDSGDVAAFSFALTALMDDKTEQLDEERNRIVSHELPGVLFWPRSFVSIEGLALICLAETAGMSVEGEFPLCPRIGRLATTEREYTDVVWEAHKLGMAERK